jgi:hypothetical protein
MASRPSTCPCEQALSGPAGVQCCCRDVAWQSSSSSSSSSSSTRSV